MSELEVVAIGARTPVGGDAIRSAAAIRAGISRCREFPFVGPDGGPLVLAADPWLDATLEGSARMEPMLASALTEVVQALARGTPHRGTHCLLLALPEIRPGFSEQDAVGLADAARSRLRAGGVQAEVRITGRGHAGVVQAIEQADELVRRDPNSLYWVAGVESYHHAETLLCLEQAGRCAHAGVRAGFIPGEGAGCIALASGALRRRLGLPGMATIAGVKTATELLLRDSETGSFGVGLSLAVQGAAAALLPDQRVDALYTDINGERYRSEEWGFVALRTAPLWRSLQYEAPADRWGDVGAAFAALAAILAVQSFQRGYARGPRAMVLAGSDAGLRGALLLQRLESA